MSEIFLREVRLNDFRTFGKFALPIPPGPGLTLLVGTNGLGKSSFFDGIEWCLTGSIRRFRDFVGRLDESAYLTRRDAELGTHRVSLTFSEGEPLTRALREKPAEDALIGLLKDPNWTEIKDIAAYLGFTHFLGQASQQRFTSRDQADQWQALKGPSGIDRLESIRTALRGRATTHAFRRRAEREESLVNIAERALEDWRGNVTRLTDLRTRGAAVGAESEAVLGERIAAIARTLSSGDEDTADFTERLSKVRQVIEADLRKVAQDRAGLDGLRGLAARFAEAFALIDPDGARLSAAKEAVAAATAELSEAMLAASQADKAAGVQTEIVARAQSDYDECVRVRTAIAEFASLDAERQAVLETEAALKVEHEACRQDVAAARDTVTRANEAQARLGQLDNEQSTLQLWSARVAALEAQKIEASDKRKSATAADDIANRARAQLPELDRAVEGTREAQAAAEDQLAVRQRDASQLAELLSGLATHIGHNDTTCPICTSTFAPGELQERARNALASQDVQLAEEIRALDALRDRSKAAAEALAEAHAAITAAVAAETAAALAEAGATAERDAIATGLGVSSDSDLETLVAERLAEGARVRVAHIRDVGGSPDDVSSAQLRVDALSAQLMSLDERLAAATQRRARCEVTLRAIEDSLVEIVKPWSVETAEAAVTAQGRLLEAERASSQNLRLLRAQAANAESIARERLAAAEADRDRVAAAIDTAKTNRSATAAAWLKSGMIGDPSAQTVDIYEKDLGDRATALFAHLEEINALSRSHEAWLAQDELRALRELMNREGGEGAADNPVVHEQTLQKSLQAARSSLRLTGATRDAVIAYGEKLRTEAESFSTQFLLPLNDLIDAFNRALLSTSGETVQFSADHTVERTALAMQLRYADPIENAQYRTNLPPQLVLSEGQMAANGFSILCAASTAYRWSRWRALLLDDPLQHNDIIHAAAFVDVMRNLVELEGYQLIMSSHKRDEGEFIARKFDAAGLPCTIVELIGASKDGVRAEPPRHNSAARRLLAVPEAKLA
ncbi:AAA family ATPase [Bradyrhizobium diazoefficiens]|uniref:AAA family ATPase n=1 Tax=Bradyrhizobium diazoefficiens TaxID=1355477 RepID=UPI00190A12F6|nr:AAA family ATPase [Bradyrhizobium diazoefficiens]QQO12458.1 AAA family ATPase [Bradyrhizobium diazoefficiens]